MFEQQQGVTVKLPWACGLRSDDVLCLLELADMRISKDELSTIFSQARTKE